WGKGALGQPAAHPVTGSVLGHLACMAGGAGLHFGAGWCGVPAADLRQPDDLAPLSHPASGALSSFARGVGLGSNKPVAILRGCGLLIGNAWWSDNTRARFISAG